MRGGARLLAQARPLGRILDELDHGRGERFLVAGGGEPARPAVLDDQRGAQRPWSHRRQPAGHALDQNLPELLALAGQDDRVGCGEQLRQLFVPVPAGKEHIRDFEPPGDLRGMLALPLARVAAHEHETRGGGQPLLCLPECGDQAIQTLVERMARAGARLRG